MPPRGERSRNEADEDADATVPGTRLPGAAASQRLVPESSRAPMGWFCRSESVLVPLFEPSVFAAVPNASRDR
jgi:hypothetical protein